MNDACWIVRCRAANRVGLGALMPVRALTDGPAFPL